jgi:hypothetical protein
MWLVLPFVYIAYLLTVPTRRFAYRRWPRSDYWSMTVSFHAKWGIALSVPGATISLLGGLGDTWHWIGVVTLAGTLWCWAVALDASADQPIRPWLAWLPLGTVLVSLNALAAFAGIPPDPPQADWGQPPEPSDWLGRYVEGLALMSHAGLGLVAWLVVTLCFALSVRRVNALTARASAELVTSTQATSGFVWPH